MNTFEEALKAMQENKPAYIVTMRRYIIKDKLIYVSSDGQNFEKTQPDFSFSLDQILSKNWTIEEEVYPILEPCVFCDANKASIYDDIYNHIHYEGTFTGYYVKCENCMARGSVEETELKARKKWNR